MIGFRNLCFACCAILVTTATSAAAGFTKIESQKQQAELPPFRELTAPAAKPSARECEERRRTGRVRRLAFIVGNNTVQGRSLQNAIGDALLIQNTLLDLGYEVASVFDATRQELLTRLDRFKEHVKSLCEHDVALFYYAGNGFEISGVTYSPLRT